MGTWEPDWLPLPPEPPGADEDAVQAFYERVTGGRIPWDRLLEWQREAWRREYRDH